MIMLKPELVQGCRASAESVARIKRSRFPVTAIVSSCRNLGTDLGAKLPKEIAIILVLGLCVFLSDLPAWAQTASSISETPRPAISHSSTKAPLDKDFRAVLAFPRSVSATSCSRVPVTIRLVALGKKPIPAKVTAHGGQCMVVSGDQVSYDVDVPISDGVGHFELSIDSGSAGFYGTMPISFWVTSQSNPFDYLCDEPSMLVTGLWVKMKIVKLPNQVPADGKTTAKITVETDDDKGRPVGQVPCCIFWNNTATFQQEAMGTESGDDGIITFTVPASKQPLFDNVSFIVQCGASAQAAIQYVKP